jgi:hypothetical protein
VNLSNFPVIEMLKLIFAVFAEEEEKLFGINK